MLTYSRHSNSSLPVTRKNHRVALDLATRQKISIAFKPAESGWGGGGKYTRNYDNIFGSPSSTTTATAKKTSETKERTETAVNVGSGQNDVVDDGKSCNERGRV
jgi:hypothetical protein